MVKLGLAFGTPPTVEANLITLHDGDEINYDNSNNLMILLHQTMM